MSAVSPLLGPLIDYAGLFPPAQLSMHEAVSNYAAYLAGSHRAMLGRFVVPLARLPEFETAFDALPAAPQQEWPISVLASGNPAADAEAIAAFNARRTNVRIVSVETKATSSDEVTCFTASFASAIEVWVELPPAPRDLPVLVERIRAAGRGAKLRTGGVTPDAFPAPAEIARFLRECHRQGVAMKATAGLHHPLRGDYRLTYEAASAHAKMFGFLNVFLAAALVHAGGSDADTIALLEDGDASHFTAAPDALVWRGRPFTTAQLDATRRALCRSFGSCSFTEPIEGLQKLRWI
jgi:hypothetical protein